MRRYLTSTQLCKHHNRFDKRISITWKVHKNELPQHSVYFSKTGSNVTKQFFIVRVDVCFYKINNLECVTIHCYLSMCRLDIIKKRLRFNTVRKPFQWILLSNLFIPTILLNIRTVIIVHKNKTWLNYDLKK